MTDPVWPLTVEEGPALEGDALTVLAGLFTVTFGLSGDGGDVFTDTGVEDPTRFLVGMVRPVGDHRSGLPVIGRHEENRHGAVFVPEATVVVCMNCVLDTILIGGLHLTSWATEQITALVAEASIARPACATVVIPLRTLEPLLKRAVDLRDAPVD